MAVCTRITVDIIMAVYTGIMVLYRNHCNLPKRMFIIIILAACTWPMVIHTIIMGDSTGLMIIIIIILVCRVHMVIIIIITNCTKLIVITIITMAAA
jgi:hypothetical protein